MPKIISLAESDITRFWKYVDKSGTHGSWNGTPCWIWTGGKYKTGYGKWNVQYKVVLAHRIAYQIAYGPIPPGLNALHHCDNPSCVNHAHLFVGTQADNMQDRSAKGRNYLQQHPEATMGERHPMHKLTESQVKAIRLTKGISQSNLAHLYGVCQQTIQHIMSRKSWRHIQ